MTPDLLWRGWRIHISSVIFVIIMMLMNVFVCPYSSLNITVIPFHFHYFNFCFKFYYPIVDIIAFIDYFSIRLKPYKMFWQKQKHPVISSWCSY